jgi:hypothetical protein
MRRKTRPGLAAGGTWIIPTRPTISRREFAFIVELPEAAIARLDNPPLGEEIDVYFANELLGDLAACGYTDSEESHRFGEVAIGEGRQTIDRSRHPPRLRRGR